MTMNLPRILLISACLLLLFVLLAVAVKASALEINLPWSLIPAGGGQSSSAGFTLDGSLGQPVAGAAYSSEFRLGSGFWGDAGTVFPPVTLYLPLLTQSLP